MTDPVNLFAIRGAVAQVFKISSEQIKGPSKAYKVTRARHAAAFLMKSMRPDVDMVRLSVMLGGRDGSTVRHAIRRGAALELGDPEFANSIADAKVLACCWTPGAPLPGFGGLKLTTPATIKARKRVLKIKAPRAIDKTVVLSRSCTDDYNSPLWWKKNDDNIRAGFAQAGVESVE